MDLWSGVTWLWRALRGRSVTFAALFALALLGFSAVTWLRRLLDRLDAPWLVAFVLPILLVAILARKESDWIPDPAHRLKWARGLIYGAILAAVLSALLLPDPPAPERPPRPERDGPVRHGHPAR